MLRASKARSEHLAPPVISHEQLSGLAQIGGYDSKEIADRLVGVCPAARILIVIREQASMLVSLWKGYVQLGGIRSLESFVDQQASPGNLGQLARHLEYHRLIAYYQRLSDGRTSSYFSSKPLRANPIRFSRSSRKLLGGPLPADIDYTRENRSLSPAAVAVKRLLNLVIIPVDINAFPQPKINASLLSLMKRADRAVPSSSSGARERRMKADVKAIIGSMYAESNQTISGLIDIDLAWNDYECLLRPTVEIPAQQT